MRDALLYEQLEESGHQTAKRQNKPAAEIEITGLAEWSDARKFILKIARDPNNRTCSGAQDLLNAIGETW